MVDSVDMYDLKPNYFFFPLLISFKSYMLKIHTYIHIYIILEIFALVVKKHNILALAWYICNCVLLRISTSPDEKTVETSVGGIYGKYEIESYLSEFRPLEEINRSEKVFIS